MAGTSALMGGLAGRGKQKLPKWASDIGRRYGHAAELTFEIPYQRYEGQPFADPNAILEAGWGQGVPMINAGNTAAMGAPGQFQNAMNMLQGIDPTSSPQFQQGNAINTQLGGFQPTMVGADQIQVNPITGQMVTDQTSEFMNPYLSDVVGRFTADQDIARQRAQVNRADQFASIGALGGSAHQLADAATNEAFARTTGNMAANLRKSGYDDAFQRAMGLLTGQQQVDYSQQAANQGANLRAGLANQAADFSGANIRGAAADRSNAMAQFLSRFGMNQAGAMGDMALQGGRYGQGLMEQGYRMGQDQQPYLDRGPAFDYAQFQEERGDPERRLGILAQGAGLASGVPFQSGSAQSPWTRALAGGIGGLLSTMGQRPASEYPRGFQWMGA